jgi:hypothetical protein
MFSFWFFCPQRLFFFMRLISKWSSKIDNFLASNAQIPHVVQRLMLLLHEALSSDRYSHFHQICSSIFPALQVTLESPLFFYCPILGSYVMNILSSWVFYSVPCSESKSHSLQEKSSLTLCSRLTRFSISLVDVALHSRSSQFTYLLITNEPSSCSGAHIFICIYRKLKYLASQNTTSW